MSYECNLSFFRYLVELHSCVSCVPVDVGFFIGLFDLRLFGFALFPLSLGVWGGLRLVIVAHPGLFSYIFYATETIFFYFLCDR